MFEMLMKCFFYYRPNVHVTIMNILAFSLIVELLKLFITDISKVKEFDTTKLKHVETQEKNDDPASEGE